MYHVLVLLDQGTHPGKKVFSVRAHSQLKEKNENIPEPAARVSR